MIEKEDIDKVLHKEGTPFDDSMRQVMTKYDELIIDFETGKRKRVKRVKSV